MHAGAGQLPAPGNLAQMEMEAKCTRFSRGMATCTISAWLPTVHGAHHPRQRLGSGEVSTEGFDILSLRVQRLAETQGCASYA